VYSKQPILIYLLPVVGLNSLFDGFLSTKVFTCDRHLERGRLTVINLGTAFLGPRGAHRLGDSLPDRLVAGGRRTGQHDLARHPEPLAPRGSVNRFRWDRSR
jgi:hypothetical protein